jgi:hypothetical protein
MSQDHPMPQNAIPARRQIPFRLNQIGRTPALNIIGLPELLGLASAALLLILVVFAYFYFYLPASVRLKSVEADRSLLQQQRQASGTKLEGDLTTSESVKRINASLQDFESTWLAAESSGRMSLYKNLNDLIKSNGLRNTAGPSYSPLDTVGTKTTVQPTITAEKQSNAKWQSIYPGIAVSVTVEGPYQNVRNFIRDIEKSRQFLLINAVELERVTQSGLAQEQSDMAVQRGTGRPAGAPDAGGRGAQVSLRLDLATYFRRPTATAP